VASFNFTHTVKRRTEQKLRPRTLALAGNRKEGCTYSLGANSMSVTASELNFDFLIDPGVFHSSRATCLVW